MILPEYISKSEVQRICQELGFRDWTMLTTTEVLPEEARVLQEMAGGEAVQIPLAEFQKGLEVELEHGIAFPDANVTNNHPVLTARIVLAHLKEMLDYYSRLEVAELEGDMLKASQAGDAQKLAAKYRKLVAARARLSQWEVERP
ncbi:MAG: hypothetical protein H6667_02805 [Ardenticatenaceae bacterium]|nr:hypothetical protein [Ardenticatenaceae bacterium]MCB9442937.1 hypothetical protein [Ardenticatenaceae bacterium]